MVGAVILMAVKKHHVTHTPTITHSHTHILIHTTELFLYKHYAGELITFLFIYFF